MRIHKNIPGLVNSPQYTIMLLLVWYFLFSCFQAKAQVWGAQTVYMGYNAGQFVFHQPYFEEKAETYRIDLDEKLEIGPWMHGIFLAYRRHLHAYWSLDLQYAKRTLLSNRIDVENGLSAQYRYKVNSLGVGYAFLNQPRIGLLGDFVLVKVERILHAKHDWKNAEWKPEFYMADGNPQRYQLAAGLTVFISIYVAFFEIRPYMQLITHVPFYQGFDFHRLNVSNYGVSLSLALGKHTPAF